MIVRRPVSLVFFLACAVVLRAQEARFIDLSERQQRTLLRVPLVNQPNCSPQPCVVKRETSVGDCTTALSALRVSVDHVTPIDITLDSFEADFRVLNAGAIPIDIPVSPHLSDLQPPGELRAFPYLSLALVVRLSAIGLSQAHGIGWVELYGAAGHEGTIVILKPNEWIRVKANVKLHTWPSEPVDLRLSGDFWLHSNVFKPEESGGFVDSLDLCPNRTTLPSTVEVHFSPTRTVQ